MRDETSSKSAAIDELLSYKRRNRGVITNSDAYLERIPLWTSARGFQTLPFVGKTATAYAINNAGTIAGKVDGHGQGSLVS